MEANSEKGESPTTTDKSREDLKDFHTSYCSYGSVVAENYDDKYKDVVGYDTVKETLKEKVILQLKFPHLFQGSRKPQDNILIYGPPGCGKTMLLKATSGEAERPMVTVHCYSVCPLNEAHKREFIKAVFRYAGDHGPCLLVFEDIDVLCREDEKAALSELFEQKDHCKDNILVLYTSFKPWCIVPNVRRRMCIRVYVGLPGELVRYTVVKQTLETNSQAGHSLTDQDLKEIAIKTNGFSIADLFCVTHDAMMQIIRNIQHCQHFKKVRGPSPSDSSVTVDDLITPCTADDPEAICMNVMDIQPEKFLSPLISMDDVLLVLGKTKPSITDTEIQQFEEFTAKYTNTD